MPSREESARRRQVLGSLADFQWGKQRGRAIEVVQSALMFIPLGLTHNNGRSASLRGWTVRTILPLQCGD